MNFDIAKQLIELGANPKLQNKFGKSFIDYAKENDKFKEMLNTTIKSSPINTKETFTEDEFMRAIRNKDILKVRDILDTNYDPNKACESSKCHPLEICEDFEIFKLLIELSLIHI